MKRHGAERAPARGAGLLGRTRGSKGLSIGLLAVADIAALSVWFSFSAVLPGLVERFDLSPTAAGLATVAVQLGFIVGMLGSALLGLADQLRPRRFFALAALVAALSNAGMLVVHPASPEAFALRMLTGASMAGIYPVSLKIVASWADGDLGLLAGLLVGALSLGIASPHLLAAFGGAAWEATILGTSAAALLAALLSLFVGGRNSAARRPSRRAMCCRPGGTGRCATATSAISATIGNCSACGPGSPSSWT